MSFSTKVGPRVSHFHTIRPPPTKAANPRRKLRRCLKRSVGDTWCMMKLTPLDPGTRPAASASNLFQSKRRRANSRARGRPHASDTSRRAPTSNRHHRRGTQFRRVLRPAPSPAAVACVIANYGSRRGYRTDDDAEQRRQRGFDENSHRALLSQSRGSALRTELAAKHFVLVDLDRGPAAPATKLP